MSFSDGFDVQIVHSAAEIGAEAWDGLTGGLAFASRRWYEFGEAVLSGQRPVYLIVSDGGAPVARATFWLTRDVPLSGLSRWQRLLLQVVLARWPVLLCRAPLADLPGLILPDEPAVRQAATREIVRAAQAWGRAHAVSFVIFDYLTAGAAAPAQWPPGLAPAAVPGPGTRLRIYWRDWASYLAQLGKKPRQGIGQARRRAAQLGLEVCRHARPPDLEEALALVQNVARRHNAPTPWARRALENMGMVDGVWIAAGPPGRTAAACALLRDGDAALLTLLGRDYQVPYAYLQMLYECIGCAIESGARVLRGGSGAYEVKKRLGFETEANNHVAYAAAGPVLARLARWAALA